MSLQLDPSLVNLVAVGANVLGAAMAIPQAVRLARHRRVDGVSANWAAMSIVVNAWWLAYALGTGELAIVPVAAISLVAYAAVAIALARFGGGPGSAGPAGPLLAAGTIGALPLLAFGLGAWPATGVVLGALYGIQLSPAVVTVYRSPDLRGVSTATWTIAWSEALLWGVYGLARLDPGLIAFGATGLVVSSAILARLGLQRPRSPEPSDLRLQTIR
jgi:uncharacterized protein with PQ loop repeat